MLKKLLNCILLLAIICAVYALWVIQPLSFDDWCITKPHSLFSMPPMPKTGQMIRYCFNGMYFFTTIPFSLLRFWSLFTAIVSVALFWVILSKENILMRSGLALFAVLGFPYFGHIGPWNHAAAIYTVSVTWMILWYALFKKVRNASWPPLLNGILIFILTFIAASWHEVWLISFAAICCYLLCGVFFLWKRQKKDFKLMSLFIPLCVLAAYGLAVAFYMRGGPSKFIDGRLGVPGTFASSLSLSYIIKALITGTKANIVLIKDGFPIFLLLLYIKLNPRFENKLRLDFILFLVVTLGSFFFMYIYAFLVGDVVWRVRWLCMVALSAAFYAFPGEILFHRFAFMRKDSFVKVVRVCSLIAAVIGLSYNVYFTYIYTNVDVAGWLQYRQMVLSRDPKAREGLCCRTLPAGRPKGVANWDHVWGEQDDRYRFFMGPSDAMVKAAVDAIWEDEKTKGFFIY